MDKKKLIKTLKIVIPIAFGVFLIWLTYNKSTAQERADVIKYIKEADYFWVMVSVILGLLSHISRAYRWKFTLEPLGYNPSLTNRFLAVMIAYFANLGIPRSGEILRATTLASYEKIPFEKAFGTIVAERIADLIMSFIIILLALAVQYDMIIELLKSKINGIATLGMLAVLFGIAAFIGIRLYRKSNHRFIQKIRNFVIGLKDGVLSIVTMKKKWPFVFHTIFIWTMYFFMFYVIFFAVSDTKNIDIGGALTSFVTGSFTIAATNGGLGSYPFVIMETLKIFGYSSQSGLAVGWIMWSTQTLLTVVFGLFSFVYLPFYNRSK